MLGVACLSSSCSRAGQPSDARSYSEALALTLSDPEGALRLCRSLEDVGERDDCHWVVAGVVVEEDLGRAAEICDALDALGRDECFFILAEQLMQADLCLRAGRFEENCQLHLFGRLLQERAPAGTRPADIEALAREQMRAVGAPADSYPFWVAAHDGLFMRDPSLTREDCDGVTPAASRRACLSAAGGGARRFINLEEDRKPGDRPKPGD